MVDRRHKRKRCRCNDACYKTLAYTTRRRHYANADPELALSSETDTAEEETDTEGDDEEEEGVVEEDVAMGSDRSHSNPSGEEDVQMQGSDPPDEEEEEEEEEEPASVLAVEAQAANDEGLLQEPNEDEQQVLQVEQEIAAAAQAERQPVPADIRDYEYHEHPLSEEECDNIRAFQLRLLANMPRSSFNYMRHMFRDRIKISSEWVMLRRIADLAGVELEYFDCCINSCMAFTGAHADKDTCDHCHEDRHDSRGKAKRVFCYIPLIAQLRGLYESKEMAVLMHYRELFKIEGPAVIKDVFDGEIYRKLLRHSVKINGQKQGHKYFDGPQDVAFSVCTDGFLLFGRKRRGPTATPILIQNYNLPPHIRTHHENLICVGIIPGPNHPKDIASFRYPLEQECERLAGEGVPAYDASTKQNFRLRAYQVLELGDIIAIEAALGIKGHNSIVPCRSCLLRGIRISKGSNRVYYIPLRIPKEHKPTTAQNNSRLMENVTARSHKSFLDTLEEMEAAPTPAAAKEIGKQNGIRKAPAFGSVGSIDYGKGSPWDWMHLFLENLIPNLVNLWSGRFKGLDCGKEDYEIEPHIWEEIAEETVAAVKDIPAPFVRELKHLLTDRTWWTAEAWCFWFVYLAPILLRGRFKKEKYYTHMCDLVDIMKRTLKYSNTKEELDELEEKIEEWVKKYERYYYQYHEERLPTCVLTIHGLLHVVNDIRNCGPSWTAWTFFMERFCGLLKRSLKSKRFPWANLTKRTLHITWLNQLKYRYELKEILSMPRSDYRYRDVEDGILTRNERMYEGYPDHIVVKPYNATYSPDPEMRKQVAYYWHLVTGRGKTRIAKELPQIMPSWGKVRIDDFKTTIRSSSSKHKTGRNSSYIRASPSFHICAFVPVFNGIYTSIAQCMKMQKGSLWWWLDMEPVFGAHAGKTHLLGIVVPCQTHGLDAREALVEYQQDLTLLAMDLRSIQAVIGRIHTRNKWWIIDRFDSCALPTFQEDEGLGEGEGEERDGDED